MAGFDDPAFYGDGWADVYDEHHGSLDPVPAVDFLADLAGGGPVLELAIGDWPGRAAAGGARSPGGRRRCLGRDGAAAARQASNASFPT
jgi:hypothetical protein